MIKVASCNLAGAGISRTALALQHLTPFNPDIISLQEVDIPQQCAAAYTREWRGLGWQLYLSKPEPRSGLHRVAAACRLSSRPVSLPVSTGTTRHAAFLVEAQQDAIRRPVLFVATYGYSGDLCATNGMVEDLVEACHRFNGPFALLGDWNQTADEGSMQQHIMTGSVRLMDDPFPVQLCATNPLKTRRIDFGLSDASIFPTEVWHRDGPCDHTAVGYRLNLFANFAGFCMPARAPVEQLSQEEIQARFEQVWHQESFDAALGSKDLDAAWHILSSTCEQTLCAKGLCSPGVVPRSTPVEPLPREAPSLRITPFGKESRGVQGLRRLCNRLRTLISSPSDFLLSRRIKQSLHGLRALVPELPLLRSGQEGAALAAVQALLDQRVAEEHGATLEGWRRRMAQNEHRQIAWVKERADQALSTAQQPPTIAASVSAIHPTSVIADQGEMWTRLWTSGRHDKQPRAEVLRILESLPQRTLWPTRLTITSACLREAAKTMVGKTPGPDSWATEHFLQMPEVWWLGLSRVWQCLLDGAEAPKEWRRSLVTLLPKRITSTRPIGLLQTAYRLGSKAVCRLLREWTLSWTTSDAFGGAPNFSTADAHFRIHCAFSRGVRDYVVQDLKGFFDHLHLQDVLPIMERLGAPPSVRHLLSSVYCGSERLYTSRGFTAPQWVTATRGLLQGDPLSPLLALTVGHLWATHVLRGPAKGLIFVDDRLLWVEPSPDQEASMEDALHRSHEFDAAMQLVCEPSKCAVVTASDPSPFSTLAQQLGYPMRQTLEILGVVIDLQEGKAGPLRLAPEKLLWRLKFLQRLPATMHRKIQLLWPLVFASVFWCAGVATIASNFLQRLQAETLRVFPSSFTHEVPVFLQHVLLGWHTSPFFLRDYTALRRAVRFATHRPLWLEDAPLTEAAVPWTTVLPEAAEALKRQGWRPLPHGEGIFRCDAQGRPRTFHFGHTSLRTLHQWLVEAFVSQGVHKCRRVCTSHHRSDSECARGLSLPKPPRHSSFDFTAHRKAFLASSSLSVHRAAAAAGANFWYHQAGDRAAARPSDALCMCGLKEPSRAHLTWVCPHTAAYRTAMAVAMPEDRASERLFVVPLDCYPPPPDLCHDEGEQLYTALAQAIRAAPLDPLFVATDGSALDDVAGASVAMHSGDQLFGFSDNNEDQTSFRAELLALQAIAQASRKCAQAGLQAVIYVLCDCQSAISATLAPAHCVLPSLAQEIADSIKEAGECGLRVNIKWCPSHGKKATWQPDFPLDAAASRHLNELADTKAKAVMHTRHTSSSREDWHRKRSQALLWSESVVQLTALTGDAYQRCCQNRQLADRQLLDDDGD